MEKEAVPKSIFSWGFLWFPVRRVHLVFRCYQNQEVVPVK